MTLERLRRAAGPAAVLVLAVILALLAWALLRLVDPRPWVALLAACGPLLIPGAPAALMLGSTLRHGDPYDVRHRYPSEGPGSVGPRE